MIGVFTLSDNIISPTLWHADSDPEPEHPRISTRSVTGNCPPPHRFSLLRVSRQIYAETAILPYHLSTFRFYDSADLMKWLMRASTSTRAALRAIEFGRTTPIDDDQVRRWKRCIEQFPNMTNFHVHLCTLVCWMGSPLDALMEAHERIAPKVFEELNRTIGKERKVEMSYEIIPRGDAWGFRFSGGMAGQRLVFDLDG
jgi:hypothetical protein